MEIEKPANLKEKLAMWFPEEKQNMDEIMRRIKEECQRWEEIARRKRIVNDSVGAFLIAEEGFCYDPQGSITSAQLYAIYCSWCENNKVMPEALRTLSYRLKHNREQYPAREALLSCNGQRIRGFRGIRSETDATDK